MVLVGGRVGVVVVRADAVRSHGKRDHQEFCVDNFGSVPPTCTSTSPCQFRITYGGGSSTTDFLVTDLLQYDQVSGDGRTISANASVLFRCGAELSGDLGSSNQGIWGPQTRPLRP